MIFDIPIKENNSKVDERPKIDFSGVKYDI